MAWLCERWREDDRDPKGRIGFTLYQLGKDLHNRDPSGRDRQAMRASLERLFEARFELEGYCGADAQVGRLEDPIEGGWIRLLGAVRWSRERERHVVHLGGFVTEQLEHGNLTYLDWRVLRKLEGLAKRLWVHLESQSFKRSGVGEGSVRLWLAPPMLRALGMTDRHAPQARRTLMRASERISAADRSFVGFELRRPQRRGGTWALVARRRLPSSAQSPAS